MLLLLWALQILILAAGIYLFLRFVLATRGSRLIRGLVVTVLIGVVGLWGLSQALVLEELGYLLEAATPFIIITLAIVFQPELRRAIAQLGQRSLVGRLMKSTDIDTLTRVVRAARAMAKRRHGALIAFERESSLGAFVEAGTPLDSGVNARLLESIFNPATPLHDGAIVIRKDRIVAAGCIFPLPQEAEIDASLGTRHRAAIGLTEENDSVVLVVSEETGRISLAKEGRIRTAIDEERIEEELRHLLEDASDEDPKERSLVAATLASLRSDLAWLAVSVAIASGIFYAAHRSLRRTRELNVQIAWGGPSDRQQPHEGEILVVLPEEGLRLVAPAPGTRHPLEVSGSGFQLEEIGGMLSGVLKVTDPEWAGGPLDLADVDWEPSVPGVSHAWSNGSPKLVVERFETQRTSLSPDNVVLDTTDRNPRYEVALDEVRFSPDPSIVVVGPVKLIDELGKSIELKLETIKLHADDRTSRQEQVGLARELVDLGFALQGEGVTVTIPIRPARRDAGVVSKEIALVNMSADSTAEPRRWQIPANLRTARFTIETYGLIPATADTEAAAYQQRIAAIKRYVEENLLVWVDVSELPAPGEGRAVPVRHTLRGDWSTELETLGIETVGERNALDVRLESEESILLEQVEPPLDAEETVTGTGDQG